MAHLHEGHRARLRLRLEREGLDGFQPHEVIELLLFTAIPVRNVNQLAHQLIDRFGSVRGVLGASKEELMTQPGVGEFTADWLTSLRPVLDEYLRCRLKDRPQLTTFNHAAAYAGSIMPDEPVEQLWVIGMTLSGHLLSSTRVAIGSAVHKPNMRQLIDFLLRHRAQTALLAQRRGAADMEPGERDRALVERLDSLLVPLRIYLMDSMLFSGHRQLSLRKLDIVRPARPFSILNEEGEREMDISWIE